MAVSRFFAASASASKKRPLGSMTANFFVEVSARSEICFCMKLSPRIKIGKTTMLMMNAFERVIARNSASATASSLARLMT